MNNKITLVIPQSAILLLTVVLGGALFYFQKKDNNIIQHKKKKKKSQKINPLNQEKQQQIQAIAKQLYDQRKLLISILNDLRYKFLDIATSNYLNPHSKQNCQNRVNQAIELTLQQYNISNDQFDTFMQESFENCAEIQDTYCWILKQIEDSMIQENPQIWFENADILINCYPAKEMLQNYIKIQIKIYILLSEFIQNKIDNHYACLNKHVIQDKLLQLKKWEHQESYYQQIYIKKLPTYRQEDFLNVWHVQIRGNSQFQYLVEQTEIIGKIVEEKLIYRFQTFKIDHIITLYKGIYPEISIDMIQF